MIDIDKIDIINNIRESYDKIDELAENIKIYGVQQPIKVIERNGKYEVLFGHRRYLANKKCAENDMKFSKIPCFVESPKSEEEIIELQLIENVDRDDLKDYEKGLALSKYKELTGKTNSEIAERFGKKEKWVRDILSVTEIIKNVESSPATNLHNESTEKENLYRDIPTGIIVETKGLDADEQKKLLDKVIEEGLKRDDVRAIKKDIKNNPQKESSYDKDRYIKATIEGKRYMLEKDKLNKVNDIIKFIEKNKNEFDEVFLNMFKDLLKKLY
jgi:ParB family chromosome partitioning protein